MRFTNLLLLRYLLIISVYKCMFTDNPVIACLELSQTLKNIYQNIYKIYMILKQFVYQNQFFLKYSY